MRLIQGGEYYSRIQFSPEEISAIYWALSNQMTLTLKARGECELDSSAHKKLGEQLELELLLMFEFNQLRKTYA